jgi:enoyl-CoA hydratase/carnithine racemase
MSELITTRREEDVFLIGLNRVEKRNALNPEMLIGLAEAYTAYEHDTSLRVAILHAHGDHFCGGLELDACAEALMSPTGEALVPAGCLDPWGIKTERVSKPVIMAAQGYCLTAALELCLASDIVIAADNAQFAQLEISRGAYPVGGGTTRWQLASGYQNSMRYLLTGDFFDADEARRIGIVQDIVAPEELLDYALSMAKKIAAHAPMGVRATLKTARTVQDHGQQAAADLLYPLIQAMYQTEDTQRGIATFKDRERPVFHDR